MKINRRATTELAAVHTSAVAILSTARRERALLLESVFAAGATVVSALAILGPLP